VQERVATPKEGRAEAFPYTMLKAQPRRLRQKNREGPTVRLRRTRWEALTIATDRAKMRPELLNAQEARRIFQPRVKPTGPARRRAWASARLVALVRGQLGERTGLG
jgi:hypothetical protein